jgi:repressor LexA
MNPHTTQSVLTAQPLTPKEKSVLEFLEVYARLHGFAPTYQEICRHFGFASFNSAQRYLKQLESKGYISLGGANQKRAISLLRSASAYQDEVEDRNAPNVAEETSSSTPEAFQVPMLGRVAAGVPLEAYENDEYIDVPASLVKRPERTFALRVQGQSMIEDGIFDGDVILVQRQNQAENGEIVVAVVRGEHGPEEATVKRYFQKKTTTARLTSDNFDEASEGYAPETNLNVEDNQRIWATAQRSTTNDSIELRPANSTMKSFWYSPGDVQIRGVVVGLIRKFW